MADDLAKLTVAFEANSAKFTTELERMNRRLQGFEKQTKRAVDGVRRSFNQAFAGLAAGFTIAAFASAIKGALDFADHLGDLSQQTGLTVQQLQALGNVAAKNGSSLDEAAAAVTKFNKVLSEAAGGSKDQALAFQLIGVSLKDVAGNLKPTGQLLDEVAKKLSGFQDGANKTALEMEFFGKSGAELTATLNQLGSEGLDPTIDRLRQMGVLISDETVKSADEFNSKLVDAQAVMNGFKLAIAQGMLPVLDKLVSDFTSTSTNAESMDKAMRVGVAGAKLLTTALIILKESVVGVGELLGSGFASVTKAFEGITLKDLLIPGAAALKFFKNLDDVAEVTGEGVIDFGQRVGTAVGQVEDIWKNAGLSAQKASDGVADGLKKTGDAAKTAAPSLQAAKEGLKKSDEEAKKLAAALKQAEKALGDLTTDLETQIATFDKSEAEVTAYRLSFGDLSDEIKLTGAKGEAAKVKITGLANELQRLADTKAIQEGLAGVQQQLDDLTGNKIGAALGAFDQSQKDLLEKLDRQKNQAGKDQVAQLRKAVAAQAQFEQLATQRQRILDELQVTEQRISNDREAGAISDLGQIAQLDQARESSLLKLQALQAQMQQIADDSGLPALIDQANQAGAEIDDLKAHTDLLAKSINTSLADGFGDAFADILTGTKSVEEAFASMGKAIINEIARIVAQKAALSIFGGTGGIGGFVASIFGGGKADGGPVAAGVPYMIGERGPELFVPNHGGSIVPNHELGGTNIQVVLKEDASRAGRVNRRMDNGRTVLEAFVADIRGGGEGSRALQDTFGLTRVGR